MWAKHIIGDFNRRFRGGQDLFDPQIVLPERSGGQFLSQKSRGPLKKTRTIADYVFFQQKLTSQTIRISGALVFHVPVRQSAQFFCFIVFYIFCVLQCL
jgi:hypothetical protein